MEPDLGKKKEWDEILNYMDNINLYAESSVLCFQDSKLYEKLLRFVTNDRTFQIHQCILTEDHDGMYFPTSSIMHRYKLYGIYESRPYEGEIIVKLQTHNTHGSNITMGLLQENEMIAYETIIPVLENFCDGHFPAPLVFYARSEVLVMEFLGNRHFLPIHKTVKGVRHEYVEPILKSLAKFHAASYGCKFKNSEKFLNMEDLPQKCLFYHRQDHIVEYMELYFEKLIEAYNKEPWSDELENIVQTLTNLRQHFIIQLKKLDFDPDEYDVFCHGDLRACNILIEGSLEDASFIDFQQICNSSVARDLVTLFYVNLQPEELHHCTEGYLKSYWNHLHLFLKQQEINLEATLTEEWLDEEMKRFQVYGIVYGLWHIAEFYIDNGKEQMTLHNLSKHKCGDFDFESEFIERAKSLLLYYIKQVSVDEQFLLAHEVLHALEENFHVSDEEVEGSDEDLENSEGESEDPDYEVGSSELTAEESSCVESGENTDEDGGVCH